MACAAFAYVVCLIAECLAHALAVIISPAFGASAIYAESAVERVHLRSIPFGALLVPRRGGICRAGHANIIF